MWHITEAVVVEGRYDVIRLRSLLDTLIVQTNGFRIFKDREQLAMLRMLAQSRGLVVLTDSDSAGFLIRDHISAAIPREQLKHAYIPARPGREKRKTAPGREGLLGVEGMDGETLLTALTRAGVTISGEKPPPVSPPFMSMSRLYADGFSGQKDSKRKREMLCGRLSLPPRLSSARLIEVLNAAFTEEAYMAALPLSDGGI